MNLIQACIKGDSTAVKMLLIEGADVNTADKSGRTALIEAAWNGNTELVKLLLSKGAEVDAADKSGFTALMRAAEEGHTAVVLALLTKGAEVNLKGIVRGATPLMLASENGHLKIIQALLKAGAKINEVDQYEETAMARAYKANQLKAAQLLEENGGRGKPDRSSYTYSQSDKEIRTISKSALPQLKAALSGSDYMEEIDETDGDE